jgi:hypothetical protein
LPCEPEQAPSAVAARGHLRDTRMVKLYHATSRAIAERIKVEGFPTHEVLYREHPATGGNWLRDNPETDPTAGLVMMSIEIPDDELADQPLQDQPLRVGEGSDDCYVEAEILNRHLDSIQIEE